MTTPHLTDDRRLELYRWMRLTRTFDERMLALWKQGRGIGGTFSQRGHEAISVGSALTLGPDDVVAPLHRDVGCYLVRGLTPRRIFANLLGRGTGVTRGRDANLHGMGDLSLGIVGFISHLPQSLPVAVGFAAAFRHRREPRVALTYCGDGSSSTGLFHESLNLAAVLQAPVVFVLENNRYAYSTPLEQQTRVHDLARRADAFGMPGVVVEGNDVEAVYEATREAVDRAREGAGPTLIEAKTMRMLGHAIHDGAEYVPRELLLEWEEKDPVRRYQERLVERGTLTPERAEEIGRWAAGVVQDAIDFAESSPWPDAASVAEGVYA